MQAVLRSLPNPDIEVQPGRVFSRRFQDIYFALDGPAETHRVYLQPARIVERVQDSREFTIFEFGFGSGLNFLTLLRQLSNGNLKSRVRYIAVEQYPLRRQDIETVLRPFAADLRHLQGLVDFLPPPVPGWHRRFFLGGQVELTLGYESIDVALTDFLNQDYAGVDAWFLDGFNPAKNPDMWDPELFNLMSTKTKMSGTVTTFTAAGDVRRALNAAGFQTTRIEGEPGQKRHSTLGLFNGDGFQPRTIPSQVTVVGAGIAGCSVSRALAQRNLNVKLYDKTGIAQLASSNTQAIQHPRLSAVPNINSLYRIHSYAHSEATTRPFNAHRTRGAIQVADENLGIERIQQVADFFEDDWCNFLHTVETKQITKGLLAQEGIYHPKSAVVNLQQLCTELISHPQIELNEDEECDISGSLAPIVRVVAVGESIQSDLHQVPLSITHQKGQVDSFMRTSDMQRIPEILLSNGYLIMDEDTVTSGSTYEWETWTPERSTKINEQRVKYLYPNQSPTWLSRFRATRAVAIDRMPVIGQLNETTWVSLAHGSSGTTSAPFAAEQITSEILQEVSIGVPAFETLLGPHRFAQRAARKGR